MFTSKFNASAILAAVFVFALTLTGCGTSTDNGNATFQAANLSAVTGTTLSDTPSDITTKTDTIAAISLTSQLDAVNGSHQSYLDQKAAEEEAARQQQQKQQTSTGGSSKNKNTGSSGGGSKNTGSSGGSTSGGNTGGSTGNKWDTSNRPQYVPKHGSIIKQGPGNGGQGQCYYYEDGYVQCMY